MSTPAVITSERSLVSENGTAQNKPPQSSIEIDKFLIANITVVVWLIFFAIGGGILALYYAKIGYIPDIEWKAALVYLFIGSLVGTVIGLLLTLSVYIPGVLWSEFILFEPGLNFAYDGTGETNGERCIRSVITYLGIPFLAGLLFSHVALLAGKKGFWLFAGIILLAMFVTIRIRFKEAPSQQLFKISFWFTLSVFLNQISMYVIYWLSGRPSGWQIFIPLTIMCTTGVWITNHIVALRHRNYPRQAVIASLLAAGLLLFTADHFSSLSLTLMKRFGFGDYKMTVVLNDHGAGVIHDMGLNSTNPPPRTLDNVELLSKVGDYYYLRVNETYIMLPKTDVVAFKKVAGQ
jgi:hypothetical protein